MITRVERWVFTLVFIALVLFAVYEEYQFSRSNVSDPQATRPDLPV